MLKKIARNLLIFYLSGAIPTNALAFDRLGGLNNIGSSQMEYKNSNRENRLLIEVNMLSGVLQKGVHQVPDNTNLVEMITLAGGPEEKAILSEVHIKRREKAGYKTIHYDLEKIVQSDTYVYPKLEDGDVVMIKRSSSDKWLTGLSIVGITLGIVVSGFLIRSELRK